MNYHNLTYPDQNNGDGLRVVLWLSGCSHHCFNCQNPQTWDENSGIEFDIEAKKELFDELSKDYISGITFSGGDPLHENNIIEVNNIIQEIKKQFPNKTIWLYTGYTWEELSPNRLIKGIDEESTFHNVRANIIKSCDVIVDGPYIDDLRDVTLKWRGSSNQRVIDVQKTLQKGEIVLWTD